MANIRLFRKLLFVESRYDCQISNDLGYYRWNCIFIPCFFMRKILYSFPPNPKNFNNNELWTYRSSFFFIFKLWCSQVCSQKRPRNGKQLFVRCWIHGDSRVSLWGIQNRSTETINFTNNTRWMNSEMPKNHLWHISEPLWTENITYKTMF